MKMVKSLVMVVIALLVGGCNATKDAEYNEVEDNSNSFESELVSKYPELETDSTFSHLTIQNSIELGEDLLILETSDKALHIYQKVNGSFEYVFEYMGLDHEDQPKEFKEELLVERGTNEVPAPELTATAEEGRQLLRNYQENVTNEEVAKNTLNTYFEHLDPEENEDLQYTIIHNLVLVNIEQANYDEALTYLYQLLDLGKTDSIIAKVINMESYIYMKMGKVSQFLNIIQHVYYDSYIYSDSLVERNERIYTEVMNSTNFESALNAVESDEYIKDYLVLKDVQDYMD